ncbi:MAG TPA: hypothetical protein VK942_10095 [Actinomycetes bacterium]|nr:hypothetical protein [Actinomycetes bacterium]
MAATSSIPAFFDALKALLDARAGIIGPPLVTVATGDLAADTPKESIVLFGTPTANREAVGLRGPQGISHDHNVVVAGAIRVVKPGQGETVIKAARDRAYAVLAELENQLKATPTVSDTCKFAAVTDDPLEQGANDEGRWAQISFQITYRARLL